MVEKKKTGDGLHQVEISQPQQGLHTDTSAHAQPPGTYRFALNAVNESKDGNLGFIINELGNKECIEVLENYTVIGSIYISDDEIIVFLAPINAAGLAATGIIGKITNGCDYEDILRSDCLEFNAGHPIEATHRIRNGCEHVLYFTDNFNPIREINISSLDQYLIPGQSYSSSATNIWDCVQFKLIPDYQVPVVDFIQIHDTGGFDMSLGMYQLALRYLDVDLNPTNWCAISNPIPITADTYGPIGIPERATKISGGYNEDHQLTTKSIEYTINNLDQSFEYLDIAMIRTVSGNGEVSDAYIMDSLPIEGVSIEYTLRGKISSSIPVDLNDLVIPRVPYDTAKTIEQIDQRLVLGNLTSPYIDHEELQRAASNIGVTYHTSAQKGDEAHSTFKDCSAPSGENYFSKRTYMRDEVYALGIIWILKDGTESPVYHIPGRAKDKKARVANGLALDDMPTDGDPNSPAATNYEVGMTFSSPALSRYTETHRGILPTTPAVNGWDSFGYTTDFDSPCDGTTGYNGLHLEDTAPERWQIYNTALREDFSYNSGTQDLSTKGQMGYWEAKDYEYPPTIGCDGKPIYPYTGTGGEGDPFIMDKVRHHRMPDTTLEPHFYSPDFRYPISDNDDGGPAPGVPCVESLSNAGAAVGNGTQLISHVGINVENIVCPASMEDLVQGFKIVKAHRTDENKTVVDKGLMYWNYLAFSSPEDEFNKNGDCFNCSDCTQFVQTPTYNYYQVEKEGESATKPVGDGSDPQGYGITPVGPKGWAAHLETYPAMGGDGCYDKTSYIGYGAAAEAGTDEAPAPGRANCFKCEGNDPNNCICRPGIAVTSDSGGSGPIGSGGYNCWQCNQDCTTTSGGYTNYGCRKTGSPYATRQSILIGLGVALANFEPYDNFGHMSFHGFKSKVDGAKDKNQLFDHIKIEKIIFATEPLYGTYPASEVVKEGDDPPDERHAAYESTGTSYNHYGTPPFNIEQSIYQSQVSMDPDPSVVLPYTYGDINWFWRFTSFPFYNFPVSDSGGFVPADTGVTQGLGKFDFRNTRQQETYIFQGKTRFVDDDTIANSKKNICGIPYVFNNWFGLDHPSGNGFKRTPCDSSVHNTVDRANENRTTTAYYVSLKRTNLNQYGPIDDIIYVETDAEIWTGNFTEGNQNSIKIFGGDSFVDQFVFRKTFYGGACSIEGGGTANHKLHTYKSVRGIQHYVECDYNPTLRDAPDDAADKRYAPYGPTSYGIERGHGFGSQGGDYQGAYLGCEPFTGLTFAGSLSKTPFRAGCLPLCTNYYSYNPDFGAQNVLKKYFPLSQAYKYVGTFIAPYTNCNTCYFNFSTRIAYSQKSFQEERADHYRSFLANNYKDIPGESGSITRLFTQGNRLYTTTEEASWILQTSQQTLKTDTTILYVGTGDFLSLPPQKMGNTQVGYGGSVSQWASLKTELGVFVVDERAQKVFLLGSEGLTPIYNIGMRNWFENNMRYELSAQLKSLGYEGDFPYEDAPTSYVGIGYTAAYDTRHSRYILTKRDYTFTEAGAILVKNWIEGIGGADQIQLIDIYPTLRWRHVTAAGLATDLGLPELNPVWFEDKSWTISYSGLNSKWVSFHSYRPLIYIIGKNQFYSMWKNDTAESTKIYKHNEAPYHTFYGNEFPHVIELVNVKNPLQTMVYDNYHFLSEATDYDGTKNQSFDLREVTFNKALLYNEHQCTNMLNLTNKNRDQITMQQNSVINRVGEITLSRDERSWAFDGFRDLLQNRTIPIFSKNQLDKNLDPLFGTVLGGYIDKVINPPAFVDPITGSPLLTPLEQQRFRDKYLTIRLFFGNFGEEGIDLQNYKLVTNYIYPTTTISPR